MNALKLRKDTVDPIEIVKLAFKKEAWGKEYLLYSNGTVSVTTSIISYNFVKDYARFEVKASGIFKDNIESYAYEIDFYKDREDMTQFMKKLKEMALRVLDGGSWYSNCLSDKLAKPLCKKKEYNCWNMDNEKIEEAGLEAELEEANYIENDDFREGAIEKLQYKAAEILSKPYKLELKANLNRVRTEYIDFKELVAEINEELN